MNFRNTDDGYGWVSKILHWLIGVSMIGLIAIGWYMTGLSDEDVLYWKMLDLHEALGLSVFVLFFVKLAWLMFSPNPHSVAGLAPWECRVARIVHVAFIIALAFIPVTGFLYIASSGEPVKLYDVIEIPNIGRLTKDVRDLLIDMHYYVSYGCAVLIVVHIAAALKHHFVDLNNSLRRMTF